MKKAIIDALREIGIVFYHNDGEDGGWALRHGSEIRGAVERAVKDITHNMPDTAQSIISDVAHRALYGLADSPEFIEKVVQSINKYQIKR